MIRFSGISAKILLLVGLHALTSSQGLAVGYLCDVTNVRIYGGDPQSASLACDGAERATTFLKAQGLDATAEIDIELVAELANKDAAGHLAASRKKALVLNYTEFLRFGDWLGVPINAEIYRALVAHEVAHVVAELNFQIPKPTVQAHEYIAYVTTFATLNTAERERVLGQFPGDGFETVRQMNTTIYLCNPMRFGAEAYRHFVKQGRETDFFRLLLSGRVLTE